jgi:hypothetical protein
MMGAVGIGRVATPPPFSGSLLHWHIKHAVLCARDAEESGKILPLFIIKERKEGRKAVLKVSKLLKFNKRSDENLCTRDTSEHVFIQTSSFSAGVVKY